MTQTDLSIIKIVGYYFELLTTNWIIVAALCRTQTIRKKSGNFHEENKLISWVEIVMKLC